MSGGSHVAKRTNRSAMDLSRRVSVEAAGHTGV